MIHPAIFPSICRHPTGHLIAVDGPSGAGKTTVTALAAETLLADGVPVLATCQPSGSYLGQLARASTHELRGLPLTFLMAADRYYHEEYVIGPAIDAGQVVICDRHVTTALVLDQIDGADPDFLMSIYRPLRWPDLTIVLTGDSAVFCARAQRRGTYSRFHEGGTPAAETEAALFANAVALLTTQGYPVRTVQVGDQDARQVAAVVTALVTSLINPRKTA